MEDDTTTGLAGAIQIDEAQLKGHVDAVVRSSVEETLNGLLDADADRIRSTNPLERIIREIRRRTRVVGAFWMASQP